MHRRPRRPSQFGRPRQGLWRPAQRDLGLAAPWLRTEDRAQWTRNWRGRSAGMAPDVAAPELRGSDGRFRGHRALEVHEVRWPGMAAAVKQQSVSAKLGQSMPPGEAFSRVKIDEQLRDVGWNLTDDRPHRPHSGWQRTLTPYLPIPACRVISA